MNKVQIFTNGLVKENPVLRLVLGTCPTLAVTTMAFNGLGMGIAATFVLFCSNIAISLLRNVIPDKVRLPAYITVIATFVSIVQMLVKAYVPALPAGDVEPTLALFVVLGHDLPGVFRPGLGLRGGLRHRFLADSGRRLGCCGLFRRGTRSRRGGGGLRGWRGFGSGRLGGRVLLSQLTHRLQCRRRVRQSSARHRKACGHAGRAQLFRGVPGQQSHACRQCSRAQPAQPA